MLLKFAPKASVSLISFTLSLYHPLLNDSALLKIMQEIFKDSRIPFSDFNSSMNIKNIQPLNNSCKTMAIWDFRRRMDKLRRTLTSWKCICTKIYGLARISSIRKYIHAVNLSLFYEVHPRAHLNTCSDGEYDTSQHRPF